MKIAIAGCKHTTKDLIAGLLQSGIKIEYVISISASKAEEQNVAGYYDLSSYLNLESIPLTICESYNLKNINDQSLISSLNIDILLVMGWQRLIPDWLLNSLSIGAFGMHGSNKPLPHGRGRSPMNWSLIQGKKLFFTHLFQYLPGVDDGPIIGDQVFEITAFDDAHSLHIKNLLSMRRLCEDAIPKLISNTATFRAQPKDGVCYYPKRTAEDGLVYWQDSTEDIYNMVRAVTRPFPGAFSYLNDNKNQLIRIWKCIPFDSHIRWPNALPGEIVEVFYDGTFIVKSGDTSLLVHDYDYDLDLKIKMILGTANISRKIWNELPN
jgi:methionyl-tRNA formyltransferase